jgi:hypothetical protein
MVRPDLRRDMVGIPEISVPLERERERERDRERERERERDVEYPEGMSSPWGFTVLGNLVPMDGSELRPSTRISRK